MVTGKRAFIAGIADDNGYGWAIAKSLAAAGAEILVGTWVPVSKVFYLLLVFVIAHYVLTTFEWSTRHLTFSRRA